ncbi:acyltransferase family protein [Niabella beijingensis]|uniref:acyltransferase family protein n=1 Tax=Niabella beijingensis TaxID=2872700 RepID=UPI001CBE1CFE|nr:acyltransferase [Niabella beijingensis]MBZ4190005.1 acyltransferase [Niabella beijingensis]
MRSTNIVENRNIQTIQVLRAIASLLVVLLHVTETVRQIFGFQFFGGIFRFGGAGVDIFFVISGFIIAYTSVHHIETPGALPVFLSKRFIRIFPTYWIIISGFLMMQLLLPGFYRTLYSFDIKNILGTFLLLPDHTMVNGVSWTLTYELFFYVLFALVFLIRSKNVLIFLMMGYVLILTLVSIWGSSEGNRGGWSGVVLFPMNIEFFMGVSIALIYKRIFQRRSVLLIWAGSVLFFAGAILDIYKVSLSDSALQRVIYFGVPAFFLVWGCVAFEQRRSVNISKTWILLGDASYSLYLLHLPFVAALAKILFRKGVDSSFIVHNCYLLLIAAICIISIVFFKYIEKPVIKILNKNVQNKLSMSRGRWYAEKKVNIDERHAGEKG